LSDGRNMNLESREIKHLINVKYPINRIFKIKYIYYILKLLIKTVTNHYKKMQVKLVFSDKYISVEKCL
jgi:hypothetical protein